ncbi:hypothetical protein [Cupriavidus sp. L7L]|uniref:hypothetical protein n=1 Tax=Cupriavidus sp. L7L TaxID=2546443 RepID=UPI0010562BA1|nr:hypothetical protein [Cupriavidus sp. L7L]TDF66048.1 hypothetical protein E1J61_09400 [Cupriavidus sp. L7L]
MLTTFENDLKAVIGHPTTLRPFVCNGSPLDCTVFLVGLNPATKLKAGFWDFWVPGVGFDREAWFKTYVDERVAAGPNPGKTRVTKASRTRRLINHMIEGAGSVKVLETNIYSTEKASLSDLHPNEKETAPFDFLLGRIKPRLLVAFGIDAHRHLAKQKLDAKVLEIPHFADREAGWSNDKAFKLGEQVKVFVGTA